MPGSQWQPQNALVFGANPQFIAPDAQRRNKRAFGENARQSATIKFRNANWRSNVGLFARKSDCLNLAVRQALFFAKRFRGAGMPMLDALVQCSHP